MQPRVLWRGVVWAGRPVTTTYLPTFLPTYLPIYKLVREELYVPGPRNGTDRGGRGESVWVHAKGDRRARQARSAVDGRYCGNVSTLHT